MITGLLFRGTSALWSAASATARELASRELLLKPERLDCRVISVGNLQAGGAGKTPLVAELARQAEIRGKRAAILCRGYGGAWEITGGTLSPGQPANALECGDEAALLSELAPAAWIGVGADRVAQFHALRKSLGRAPDLVILDDGFQHWRIHKDLEMVAVTSRSRGETLYRDWSGALARADLVVWTKGDIAPEAGGRPLIRVRFVLPEAMTTGGGAAPKIWLITGVADGNEVLRTTRAAGYDVVGHTSFPDHAVYARPIVAELRERARGGGYELALTGKDWVKWREFGVSRADVRVLEPEVRFEGAGRALWDRILWAS